MDVRKKEGENLNISFKLDKKNFSKFISDIKRIGKEYEHQSNSSYLNYSIINSCNRIPYMNVKGWCSRVVDKKGKVSEVFFCDYDNILWRIVEQELTYLMEQYDLPPFYIFYTKKRIDPNGEEHGNYLVINLKKNNFRDVIQMQNELHCDQAYKKVPLVYRFKTWVLRLGPKGNKDRPKFLRIIGNPKHTYKQEISGAHLAALENLYPEIPKLKYFKNDKGTMEDLYVTEYLTASK